MARWPVVLALLVVAAASAPVSATTTPPDRLLIPYLSGGAGVYLDDNGRPVTSEGAPHTPGIHIRPTVVQPEPQPPLPQPQPQPRLRWKRKS